MILPVLALLWLAPAASAADPEVTVRLVQGEDAKSRISGLKWSRDPLVAELLPATGPPGPPRTVVRLHFTFEKPEWTLLWKGSRFKSGQDENTLVVPVEGEATPVSLFA